MRRTQTEESYMDFADKFIIGALPDEYPNEENWSDGLTFSDNGEVGSVPSYISSAESYLRYLMESKWTSYKKDYGSVFTPRQWKHMDMIIKERLQGLPNSADAFKLYKQRALDRAEYAANRASKYYEVDFKELTDAIQPLVDAQDEIRKLQLSAAKAAAEGQQAKGEYDTDYYGSLDGNLLAGAYAHTQFSNAAAAASNATTASNQAEASAFLPGTAEAEQGTAISQETISKINAIKEAAENKTITKLKELSDGGSRMASAMLYYLSLVRAVGGAAGTFLGPAANVAGAAIRAGGM